MARLRFEGSKLQRHRREAGLTQAELARLVGRCPASIVHYEGDLSVPPTKVLLELSVLGVEPCCLLAPAPVKEEAMT
jgi:DNA-binding XRE family transcriptional regulator